MTSETAAGERDAPGGPEAAEPDRKACACCGSAAGSGSEYCYVCIGREHDRPDDEEARAGEQDRKACVCCGSAAGSGSEYCYVCIGRGHDRPDAEEAWAGSSD